MIVVHPIDDIEAHDLTSTTRPCHPTLEIHSDDILLIHNAFDNREKYENKNIETHQLWEVTTL